LVGLVSDDRATYGAGSATDEGAFAGMTGLIADDGSRSRSHRATYQRTLLSPRGTPAAPTSATNVIATTTNFILISISLEYRLHSFP